MPDYEKLPARPAAGLIHVVVETPRGARAKFKYDPTLKVFTFSRTLTLGLVYPFDWGFIPSTLGEDGDPLDVMILHEAATGPGMVVTCRPIGILNVLQSEPGKKNRRNDRILAIPAEAGHQAPWRDVHDVGEGLKDELQRFFVASVALQDKRLEFLGWGDAAEASANIDKHLEG